LTQRPLMPPDWSGKEVTSLQPPPLRTVLATFTAHGSSKFTEDPAFEVVNQSINLLPVRGVPVYLGLHSYVCWAYGLHLTLPMNSFCLSSVFRRTSPEQVSILSDWVLPYLSSYQGSPVCSYLSVDSLRFLSILYPLRVWACLTACLLPNGRPHWALHVSLVGDAIELGSFSAPVARRSQWRASYLSIQSNFPPFSPSWRCFSLTKLKNEGSLSLAISIFP